MFRTLFDASHYIVLDSLRNLLQHLVILKDRCAIHFLALFISFHFLHCDGGEG